MTRRETILERRLDSVELIRPRVALRQVSGNAEGRFWVITSIQGGQTIWSSGASSLTGIKYITSGLTTVPNVDPNAVSLGSMANGLGRGLLGGTIPVYVATQIKVDTTDIHDLVSDLPSQLTALARTVIYLPVGVTDVVAPVYLVWKV